MEGAGITPVMPVNGGYGDGFGCDGGVPQPAYTVANPYVTPTATA